VERKIYGPYGENIQRAYLSQFRWDIFQERISQNLLDIYYYGRGLWVADLAEISKD
jgi:hypothetical protein